MRPSVAAAFIYLSLVWGSTYLFIKIVVGLWPPILAAWARNFVAFLALLLGVWLLRRSLSRDWRDWWAPIVYGVFNGISFALIFLGQPYIPSGQSAVLVATMPMFALFIAHFWLHEPLTRTRALAVGLGLLGVLLATSDLYSVGFVGTEVQRILGQGAGLAAALSYAIAYVLGQKCFHADTFSLTVGHLFSSSTFLLILALLLERRTEPEMLTWPAIGALLYLAVPGSAFAYWCFIYLVQEIGAVRGAYVTIINPVVAVFLGALVFGEALTPVKVTGTALVVGGAWLLARGKGHEPRPT